MLIPVRCFTCGSPAVSARWLEYRRRLADEDAEAVLDALGIRRYCCRTVMLCQPDLVETILSQTTRRSMTRARASSAPGRSSALCRAPHNHDDDDDEEQHAEDGGAGAVVSRGVVLDGAPTDAVVPIHDHSLVRGLRLRRVQEPLRAAVLADARRDAVQPDVVVVLRGGQFLDPLIHGLAVHVFRAGRGHCAGMEAERSMFVYSGTVK